jgi:hypothetical protein
MPRKVVLSSLITLGTLLAVFGIVSGQVVNEPIQIQEPISPTPNPGQVIRPGVQNPAGSESLQQPTARTFKLSCTNSEFATIKSCFIGDPSSCVLSHHPCYPYKCDSSTKTCAMECESKDQCWTGTDCVDGKCKVPEPVRIYCSEDNKLSMNTAGEKENCEPYVCNRVSGLCKTMCATTGDCTGGYTCDIPSHVCERTG